METTVLSQPFNQNPVARAPLWEKSQGRTSPGYKMVDGTKASGLWTRSKGFQRQGNLPRT